MGETKGDTMNWMLNVFHALLLFFMVWYLVGCTDTLVDSTQDCEFVESGDILWGTGVGEFVGIGVDDGTRAAPGLTLKVLDSKGDVTFTTEVIDTVDLEVSGVVFLMFVEPQPIPNTLDDFVIYELYECRQ